MATLQTQFNLVRRRAGVNYPSPFFDISSTYVPPSIKEMFKWTRFYYYSHSIIHPIIHKMAEYPITGFIYQSAQDKNEFQELALATREKWKTLLESTLRLKSRMMEILLDYNVYGNCFVSVMFPFKRYLSCPKCANKVAIEKASYKWHDLKFKGECEECKEAVEYDIHDVQIKNRSMCRLIRWNPFNIDIDHCPHTDERIYVYKIPSKDKKSIVAGKKFWIERAPYIFIDAVRKNQDIEIDTKNLFHFKRPSVADNDMGWGMPLILPVIKDAYWLQILRKANEAISLDHIVPWRIIFPQPNADVSPFVNINLGSWKDKVEREIKRWRQDPNHISVFPIPIGHESIGNDGKLLQVWQEEKHVAQQIAGGLGVPIEFIWGGLSYSGSSVSLRILENHFITARELLDEFLNEFLVPKLEYYFRLPKIHLRQRNFKMADDVQQKQLAMQLNQMGKLSDTTFLSESGFDFEKEISMREREQHLLLDSQRKTMLQQAELQGQIQVVGAKYQAMAAVEGSRQQQIMMQQDLSEQRFKSEQLGMPPQQMIQPGGAAPGQSPQQGQPGQPGGPVPMAQGGVVTGGGKDTNMNVNVAEMVSGWAQGMISIPPEHREMLLKSYEKTHPETARLVREFLKKIDKQNVNMKPLPEQKPPRRSNSPI